MTDLSMQIQNAVSFVAYEKATGRIAWVGQCAEEALPLQSLGRNDLEVLQVPEPVDQRAWRVDVSGVPMVLGRPPMPLVVPSPAQVTADGVDELVVSGVPAGTEVTVVSTLTGVAPAVVTVNDGTFEFSSAQAGPFTAQFRCWPYRDADIALEAV